MKLTGKSKMWGIGTGLGVPTRAMLAILFCLLVFSKAAAIDATRSAGTGASNAGNGGTAGWITPGNIAAADGNNADSASSSKTDVTEYLAVNSFGFTIPAGSVISGITVNVVRSASDSSSNKNFSDAEVRLIKGGIVSMATNSADVGRFWAATAETVSYGGTNDLWKDSWVVSDIENAGFGVVVSASRGGNGGGGINAYVDHVEVTVNYEPTHTFTVNSAHGTPNPSGVTTNLDNAVVNAVMTDPTIVDGTTQYVCTGWTGTGCISSGSGTNVNFTITNDTTITWQWQANHWMSFETVGN